MKHRGGNGKGGGAEKKKEHSKATVGTIGKRKLVRRWNLFQKKRGRGMRRQTSDELPVMSTRVLMRVTALVDAPPGNKPTAPSGGMCTERDAACKMKK